MFVTVGSCPKCGAPVYTYTAWQGVVPPPAMYSCSCRYYESDTGGPHYKLEYVTDMGSTAK